MRYTSKPIRKCYSCLLNRGDHCWAYSYPRKIWGRHRKCPAFENEQVYNMFRTWQKDAHTKTSRELRQEAFREKRTRRPHPHLEEGTGSRARET